MPSGYSREKTRRVYALVERFISEPLSADDAEDRAFVMAVIEEVDRAFAGVQLSAEERAQEPPPLSFDDEIVDLGYVDPLERGAGKDTLYKLKQELRQGQLVYQGQDARGVFFYSLHDEYEVDALRVSCLSLTNNAVIVLEPFFADERLKDQLSALSFCAWQARGHRLG